jgi:hypothetical protein
VLLLILICRQIKFVLKCGGIARPGLTVCIGHGRQWLEVMLTESGKPTFARVCADA